MEKIKLTANILFSGIGCQERGFRNSDLYDMDVITTSDIDMDAILIYATIHCGLTPRMVKTFPCPPMEKMISDLENMNIGYDPKKDKPYNWKARRKQEEFVKKYWIACYISNNKGDISRIKSLPYADFWTVSFPCQSISLAGKMHGFEPDSGTRSSLLWENMRLLKDAIDNDKAPKYIMFENVKNLVGAKFKQDFEILLDILSDFGYNTYWKVLNASECGIPQNRERVFAICIRKDIDTGKYEFPKPFKLKIRLDDLLEEGPLNECYYINASNEEKLIQKLIDDGSIQKIKNEYSKYNKD